MFFNFLLSLSSPPHNIYREKGEGEKEAEGRLVTYGLWSLQRTLLACGHYRERLLEKVSLMETLSWRTQLRPLPASKA